MKTFTFFVSCLFATVVLQAQDYQISFTGSGQSTSVDSIQVKNLTQGTTVSLNGDDVLYLVGAVGINTLTDNQNTVKIYPNPMVESTFVEFTNLQTELICLEIFNGMGVLIAKQRTLVQQGRQRIEISRLNAGIYTVNVSTADWKYATKLISLGKNPGNTIIKYLSTDDRSAPENALKSTTDLIQMQYNDGEMLLFKAFSGNYATVLTLLPTQSQTVNFEFISCSDEDGNNYAVVTIGSQTWMAENLNYETENSWCYDNDGNNCDIYGRLYNWETMMNGEESSDEVPSGVQGICPDGWHVPSDNEWKILEMYLGISQSEVDQIGWRGTDEGGKLKDAGTVHWTQPNTGATNSSGYTALPGGYSDMNGDFFNIEESGYWLSATKRYATSMWRRNLSSLNGGIGRNDWHIVFCFSVRCMQD